MNESYLASFTDVLGDEIANSQESEPISLSSEISQLNNHDIVTEHYFVTHNDAINIPKPAKGTGQYGQFRSIDEIDVKYRSVFSYPFFNLVQSSVIEDALYSDKSIVVCAPTGSGKTVIFEMAIVQLLMEIEEKRHTEDFKIIYMAPVKALCTERLAEWYPKFTPLGLLCIEVTGDTDVDFSQLKPYRIIITTPEKWDMVTRRWREHRQLVEVIKLFLIDEVHILNDESRGPVLEAVVSRMKTIESSAQSAYRIEQLQQQFQGTETSRKESPPKIRFVAVSATVSNPEDVAAWLGTSENPAVYYKFGDESRPVKLKRVVEGYHCPEGASIFKFDIILNYKLWPVIQKYHNGKPTLIFCNTRKSVALTAETLSKELTVSFSPEQKAKLTALASTIKNKKLQALVLSGVGCHHAGLLFEERTNIEHAFRNRDLPILITTTTLAMGVNLPAHLVIIKNTQQYVNGAYQEYSISTILQMVGRAGRPQFDTEATAVIMTRLCDKHRYQSLVGGSEPLQSYLHKRLAENLNSEAALGTVNDVAQCVQWLRSTFLFVRAARDPKRYLGLTQAAPQHLISKKIEELCVKAMNGLATSGLITMDEASCIESTEAGRLMSIFYLDLETMKHIMKINGTESLERLLWVVCESHELADMHLRVDERRILNALNRNNAAVTIRFPMKGKISTRQMKLNCIIQAVLGCLPISDPSLNQEAMKVMRIALRVCKCLVTYITRPALIAVQPKYYSAVLNSLILAKCVQAHLWENSPYVSKQLKGIGPTFSTLLATAGKVNFMLLEESHPRDLERIMNKGPPAGNMLRKQISLLPKYQITMIPIDDKSVTLELVLLNKNYLAENIDNLTAQDCHKSYIVIGDSENNLLLLTSFKDKDLINVYDGAITYQITRKSSFEHKIFVHCISSTFVGIDAQSEYLFKELESVFPTHLYTDGNPKTKLSNKQTTITDTFRERKRKNNSEVDITQSKEKKKRDTALLDKFKCLKDSFGKTSKKLKEDLDKSTIMSNKILKDLTQFEDPTRYTEVNTEKIADNFVRESLSDNQFDDTEMKEYNDKIMENYEFMDDDKINSILHEIENEILCSNDNSRLPLVDMSSIKTTPSLQSSHFKESSLNGLRQNNNVALENYKTYSSKKKHTQKNRKSNFNFIELLEKNMNLSDEEETFNRSSNNSGFSDTIKNQIEKYLQQTNTKSKVPDKSVEGLIELDYRQGTVINEISKSNDKILHKNVTLCHENIKQVTFPELQYKSDLNTYVNTNEGNYIMKECNDQPLQKDLTLCHENIKQMAVPELQNKSNLITYANTNDGNDIMKECQKNRENQSEKSNVGEYDNLNMMNCNEKTKKRQEIATVPELQNKSNLITYANTNEGNDIMKECQKNRENQSEKSNEGEYDNLNMMNCNEKTKKRQEIATVPELQNKSNLITYGNTNEGNCIMKESQQNRENQSEKSNVGEYDNLNMMNCNEKTKKRQEIATNSDLGKILHHIEKSISLQNVTTGIVSKTEEVAIISRLDQSMNHNIKKPMPIQNSTPENTNKPIEVTSSPGLDNYKIKKPIHLGCINLENYTKNINKGNCLIPVSNRNSLQNFSANSNMTKTESNTGKNLFTHVLECSPFQSSADIHSQNAFQDINNLQKPPSFSQTVSSPNRYDMLSLEAKYNSNNNASHQNINIRKYSYFTTKFDVAIKDAPDHMIRVIKRMKMNVDVTEITSRENKNNNKLQTVHVKAEEKDSNKENRCNDMEQLEPAKRCIEYEKNNHANNAISKVNNEVKTGIQSKYIEKHEKSLKIATKSSSLGSNLECQPINQIKFDSVMKIVDDEYQKEGTAMHDTTRNENQQQDGDRLKNLLQKYSQICTNSNTGSLSEHLTQLKGSNKDLTYAPSKKPKKPFKISDIGNLKTNLHEKFISEIKKDNRPEIDIEHGEVCSQIENKEKINHLRVENMEEINYELHEQKTDVDCCKVAVENVLNDTKPNAKLKNSHNANIIQDNDEIYGNLDNCNLLTIADDLEPGNSDNEFNIDQSMFNPKTLLQCLNKEESDEIIQPPAEFCDESELLSTPIVQQNDLKIPTDWYEPLSWNNFKEHSPTNVITELSRAEFTPSKDLETWTLSQNNESYENFAESTSSTPTQCFTIMRNSGQHSSQIQNDSVSRQSRLGQFKFCRKNKLMPKM